MAESAFFARADLLGDVVVGGGETEVGDLGGAETGEADLDLGLGLAGLEDPDLDTDLDSGDGDLVLD